MSDETEERRSGASWWRDAALLLRLSVSTAPVRSVFVIGLTAFSHASQAIFALVVKWIVDGAVAGDLPAVVRAGWVLGVMVAVSLVAGVGGFYLRLGLSDRVAHRIDRDVLEITAGLPGIEHQERPDFLDDLTLLRDQREQIAHAVGALVAVIGVLAQLVVSVWLLARVHPMLMILPLFGVPSLAAQAKAQSWIYAAMREGTPDRRRAEMLYELSTTPAPAKELRLFGAVGDLVRRHDESMRSWEAIATRARLKATTLTAAGWVAFAAGYAATLLVVVSRAASGTIGLGDVILAVTLGGQLNGQVAGVAGMVGWLLQTLKTIGRYRWLRGYAARHRVAGTATDLPEVVRDGIRFEGVSFTYPGTDREILRDVDLHLEAGMRVAIVGDNGAGKSTLVKLLCGFYAPTTGRITLDGRDLGDFDPVALRERMAAGFQDFARYDLEAGEVVGIGSIPELGDLDAYDGALERAGADGVVESLDRGYRTPLGRSFDDGIELSGGQWQKLALGRAMMRASPLVLVLDEPTASLDADTEHRLFERYASAAAEAARRTGAITVLVSHRFSTVRMADRILVVDGGRIVEAGSHAELVARGGLYAELYEIQARQYR